MMKRSTWLILAVVLVPWMGLCAYASWPGWLWSEQVTLSQAGAEVQGTVLFVGCLFCLGMWQVLGALERLQAKLDGWEERNDV